MYTAFLVLILKIEIEFRLTNILNLNALNGMNLFVGLLTLCWIKPKQRFIVDKFKWL